MWKVYPKTPRRFRIFVTKKRTHEVLNETYCNLGSLNRCLDTLNEEFPEDEFMVTEIMNVDYEED